jgi:hypothetical protein
MWQTDYGQALAVATIQQKPVAVFIGQGRAGYEQIVKGGVPEEAVRLLSSNYVSVYVDTSTEGGKVLAGQFELSKGLVISSRDGRKQALWHKGEVTASTLSDYLTRCIDSSRQVITTEVGGSVRPAAPSYPAPVLNQPFVRPGFPGAPCLTGR